MWTLGSPVPEFSVRTPAGDVGPADFRGTWLALLHRSPPHAVDRAACLDRCDLLAHRLAERDCRLLVAIDPMDAESDACLACVHPDRSTGLLVGTWVARVPPPVHAPRLALVDPEGVLRAFEEAGDEHAFAEWDLLAGVDRALAATRSATLSPREPEGFGCVEWFDYGPRQGADARR